MVLRLRGGVTAQLLEELLEEPVILLDHVDNLCLVEEDEGVEGRHEVFFKEGRSRKDNFLNVLNSARTEGIEYTKTRC